MAIKVQDTFEDTNGVDLADHDPDTDEEGGGWIDTGANALEIASNQAASNANGDSSWINGGVADSQVSVDFNAGGADNRISFGARRDTAATVGARDSFEINWRPDPDELYINRIDDGASTQLGSTRSVSAGTSTTYTLMLKCDGSSISAYVDGDQKGITETDSNYPSNTYGSITQNLRTDGAGRFDNFLFEDLVAGGLSIPVAMHHYTKNLGQ